MYNISQATMASDFSSSGKRINDLRVVDLRSELEKRGLEKTGVKQALIERLKKALINEGLDVEQHDFDIGSTASQRSATRQSTGEMLQDPNVTVVESDMMELEQKHCFSESQPIDEEAESDLIAVAGDDVGDVEGQQLDTSVEHEEMCDKIAEQEIAGELEEESSDEQIEDQAEDNRAWHGDGDYAEEVAGVCDDTDAVLLHQATIEQDDATNDDDMGHCDDLERPDQANDSGDDTFLRDEEAADAVPSSSVQTTSQIVAGRDPSDTVTKMLPAERKPEDDLFVLVDDDLDNDIINIHATGTKSSNNEKSPATVAVSTPTLHSSELAGDKLVPKSGTAVLEQTAAMEDKTGTSNATTNAPVPSGGTCDGLKEEVVDTDPAKNSEKPTVKSVPKEEPALVPDAKASAACSSTASRNLWISGLSSTTRAADLKILFSKHGKVAGAKIVTNAKSPGAKCYGFVTMATTEEASKCIQHLHRTELHGRMISVERAKADPSSHVHLTEKKLAPGKPTDSATRVASLAAKRLGSGSKIMNAMPSSASVPSSSSSTTLAVAATTETPKTVTSPVSSTKAAALSGSADQAEHTPMEVDPSDIKEDAKKSVEKKESVKRDKEKTPAERHSKGNTNDGHRFSGKDHPRQPRRNVGSGFRGGRGAPYRPRFTAKPLARGMREHEAAVVRRRQERAKVHDMQERRRVMELQRERMRQRMIERAQQDEAIRLERERERLRIEKQRLELERLEAERERILLERERQRRERERIEQEREEERRLEMMRRRDQMQQVQQQHHQHQQGRSVKRAHDSGTYWHTPESKRMATSPETSRRFAAANTRVVPPPGRFDDRRHDDRPAQSTRKARSPERRPGTAVASASSVKSAVARSTHSERERLIMTDQVKTSTQHRSSAGGRAEWKPAPGGDRSKGARRDEKGSGYVPVQPSSSSMPSAHDRNGSSSGWRTSSSHGSTAAKGRDYTAVSSSSNQWISGRNVSSVQPQVTGTRSDWSNRGPGGSISAAAGATTGSTSRGAWPARGGTSSSSGTASGTGTGHSFLSSATNILMGMGVTSSRSAAAPDTRFDAYKSISSNSTSNRRY